MSITMYNIFGFEGDSILQNITKWSQGSHVYNTG